MKTINYVFIGLLVLMLIGSSIGMFFIGGYTSKAISIIIITMAVAMVTNGIHHNFFVRENKRDERNISIEEKSKAKAFDVMGIIFGLLIIIYGILKYNLLIILLAVVAYSLIFIVYMTYLSKYHKEM
jgi:hypothetical protein